MNKTSLKWKAAALISLLLVANVVVATGGDGAKLSVEVTEVRFKEQRIDIIAILIGLRVAAPSTFKVSKLDLEVELTDAGGNKAKIHKTINIGADDTMPTSAVVEVPITGKFHGIQDGTSNTFKVKLSAFALADGSVRSITATGKKDGKLAK
jgi:hypothetical protein